MKISKIITYPVKSCAGISLPFANVFRHGIEDDRRWMVVEAETGTFLSQRRFPKMALIQPEMDDKSNNLILRAPGISSMELSLEFEAPGERRVTVHDKEFLAYAQDPAASSWLSSYLGARVELVAVTDADLWHRPVIGMEIEMEVACQDSSPIHVITEASLAHLNQELAQREISPVDHDRFRPNIVIDGTEAFDEDRWIEIHIGPLCLWRRKPTSRCAITTVNQSNGEMGKEPLATLSRIRKRGNEVHFGIYLIPFTAGIVSLGQEIRVVK